MPGREHTIDVYPNLPPRLSRLPEISENLWYSWHRPARALFGPLDPDLWNQVAHNPKLFLRRVDQALLERAAADEVYLSSYSQVLSAFDTYHRERAANPLSGFQDELVAYFCAEYGLHESLPIYSGGLGILAGHHCKAASDLGVPFVGVGLMYRVGYFNQSIDPDGHQIVSYLESDFDDLPVRPARDADGNELLVSVPLADREVVARVWMVQAGHVRLFLLDTDHASNRAEDREIIHQLYGGGPETRIRQEIVLGIGGVKALRRLGIEPTVWHINEGHAAFAALELARELVAAGETFPTAWEAVAGQTVFTTHTPVPAGHDQFAPELALPHLRPLGQALGLDDQALLALARLPQSGPEFNMTTLALRGARRYNGVSRIHGSVSSEICAGGWPQVPADENPIISITNGVHVLTVLSEDWVNLFDRALGAEWRNYLCDPDYWQRVLEIPDQQFWGIRQSIKSKALATVRQVLSRQHRRNRVSASHADRLTRQVDPDDPNVLTIGFARRFATYKRATLLLNDFERLAEVVNDSARPIVFLFSGKAHPADAPGQALLRAIHDASAHPDLEGKILLLENYDLSLSRRLLAGVDVWLNNPVYPLEASGTSGMKAAMNGAINLSVTDGWWAEGFDGSNGWAIGPSRHDDPARRDAEDARTLYELLQDEVIPLYYARERYGYSPGWVQMAKRSMATILPRFNMQRVVQDYARELYLPAAEHGRRLRADGARGARELAEWKARIAAGWPGVSIRALTPGPGSLQFGERLELEIAVQLGPLAPQDIVVECVMSSPNTRSAAQWHGGFLPGEASHTGRAPGAALGRRVPLEPGDRLDSGELRYHLSLAPQRSGRATYRLRVYPHHELLSHPHETGLMQWLE